MIAIIWLLIGGGVLYFWLTGHWLGWLLAFLPVFWVVQISLTSGHGADPTGTIAIRAILTLIATGIPCIAWGSISKARRA